MKAQTTLGRRATEETPVALREHLDERIATGQKALDMEGGAHLAALGSFRDYLSEVTLDDPRLVSLSVIHRSLGEERFAPTEHQRELLARIGTQGPTPPSDVTLAELISAGLEDLVSEFQHSLGVQRERAEKAERETTEAQEQAVKAEGLSEELREAREQNDGLGGEVEELRGQLDYLREHLSAEEGGLPKPKAEKPPRRKGVDGYTGIYETELAESDGPIYEIGYQDDKGKRRWKMIGPDLEEAVAVRKELTEGVAA